MTESEGFDAPDFRQLAPIQQHALGLAWILAPAHFYCFSPVPTILAGTR